MEHSIPGIRQRGGAAKALGSRLPLLRPQIDEAEEERRLRILGEQFLDAHELARGLGEHASLVERHSEVPVLLDAELAHYVLRGTTTPHTVRESGGDEAVERLAHLELAHPRRLYQRSHIASSVDEPHQPFFVRRERRSTGRQARAIELEDAVEPRHFLFDQAPLIDAPRPFEEQRLRRDRHQYRLIVRRDVDIEAESALGPGEQEVHRLFDLQPDVVVQLFLGQKAALEQNLAKQLVPRVRLRHHRFAELISGDDSALLEDVAQAVAPIDDARVRDAAAIEIDVAEVRSVADAEDAGLLPHCQQL